MSSIWKDFFFVKKFYFKNLVYLIFFFFELIFQKILMNKSNYYIFSFVLWIVNPRVIKINAEIIKFLKSLPHLPQFQIQKNKNVIFRWNFKEYSFNFIVTLFSGLANLFILLYQQNDNLNFLFFFSPPLSLGSKNSFHATNTKVMQNRPIII